MDFNSTEIRPLTTGTDISGVLTGSASSTSVEGPDTFTATDTTYTTGDVVNGGSGTDVLNLALAASNHATNNIATVVGVETINVNATSFTDVTYTMTNASLVGSTVNLSNKQVGGATGMLLDKVGTGATIVADTSITGTLSVTTSAATTQTLTLAANSATTQTVVMTHSGTTDVGTISAAGTVGLTATTIETMNYSGNGAEVTYNTASTLGATANNVTGSQSVTLSGDEASFDGLTINDNTTAGTTTLKITTAGNSNLSKTGLDLIDITSSDAAYAYTVKAGQAIKISDATTTEVATFDINDNATANTTGAISINLAGVLTTGKGIALDATTTDDYINALTITNSTSDNATAKLIAANAAVTINGTKLMTLEAASTALSVNATGLSGVLTMSFDGTDAATVTGGSANDVFNVVGTSTSSIDGGVGTGDSVVFDASQNAKGLKLSNVEVINLDGGADGSSVINMLASQLNGKTYILKGQGASNDSIEINTASTAIDTATIDLSKLVIDTATVDKITVLGTAKSADFGVNSVLTITGSSTKDVITGDGGADTISGGAGADTLDGGAGADKLMGDADVDSITGGDGTDTITTGTGADIITFGTAATSRDTVTDFTAGTGGDQIKTANYTAGEFIDSGATATGSAFTPTGANTTGHVLEFAFEANSGASLSDGSADSLTGVNFLKALNNGTTAATITLTTVLDTDTGYVIGYQGGKAFIYGVTSGGGTSAITGTELALVGIIDAVAVGALTSANFVA